MEEEIEEELLAITSIYGDTVRVNDRVYSIDVPIQLEQDLMSSTDALGASDEPSAINLILVVSLSEFYPREIPEIQVIGAVEDISNNKIAEATQQLKDTAVASLGSCMVFELVESLKEYCESQIDLTSDETLDVRKELRSSLASAPKKKMRVLEIKEKREKPDLAVDDEHEPGSLSSKKDGVCDVCHQKVNRATAVRVASKIYCKDHASSNSSRHLAISSMPSASNTDVNDLRIRGAKQLMPILISMQLSGAITLQQLTAFEDVLLYAVPGLSLLERDAISSACIAFKSQQNPVTAANNGIREISDLISYLESMERRQMILPCQTRFLSRLLLTIEEESDAQDSLRDELRLLAFTYQDFKLLPPSLEQTARGVTTVCSVNISSDNVSIELYFQFTSDSLEVSFGTTVGLSCGDLVVLERMVRSAQTDAQNLKTLKIASVVTDYLYDVVTLDTQSDSSFSISFVPKDENLTDLREARHVRGLKSVNFDELDTIMMTQLQKKVNETRYQKKTSKGSVRKDRYQILNVENVVTPKTFSRFKRKGVEMFRDPTGGIFLPVVAWHGTYHPEVIESIVNGGLLQAGEIDEKSGYMIRVTNGSLFGEGIYTSPSLDVSHNYGRSDRIGSHQVFFSLVLLGKPRFLDPKRMETWKLYGAPSGSFVETHDSHVIREFATYISFDSACVLPFFLVTYGSPNSNITVFDGGESLFPTTRYVPPEKEPKKPNRKERKRLRRREKRRTNGWKALKAALNPREAAAQLAGREFPWVDFYPLPAPGHWLLCLTPETVEDMQLFSQKYPEPPTDLRCIFLCDKSSSMGTSFKNLVLPACSQLYRGLEPSSCRVLLFGKTIECHNATNMTFFDTLKDTKLESATNLVNAVAKAIDITLSDQDKIRREDQERRMREAAARACDVTKIPERRVVFTFFLLSDGGDTVTPDSQVESKLARCQKMIQGSGMRTIFRVISIGKRADTRLTMKCKLFLENMYSWEETPLVYARKRSQLPKLIAHQVKELSELITQQSGMRTVTLSSDNVVMEGFVTDFTQPPKSQITVALRHDMTTALLFRGPAPKHLMLGYVGYPVRCADAEKFSTPHVQTNVLRMLRSMIDSIKVRAIAGHKVDIKSMKALISSIKEASFSPESLARLRGEERVQLMRKKKGLITELRTLANDINGVVLLKGATSDDMAQWLIRADQLKFGIQTLKRSAGAIPSRVIRNQLIRKVRDIEYQEKSTDLRSVQSGLTAVGHWNEVTLRPPPKDLSVIEMLYSVGMPGVAIKVRHNNACVADPWMLCVEHVSADVWDTASAMCALDADVQWKDSSGSVCSDVLVISDPQNPRPTNEFIESSLHHVYTSVIFTRNTDLFLNSQTTALLCLSAVKAATMLLEAKLRTDRFIKTTLNIIWTCRQRMLRAGESDGYWASLVGKLRSEEPSRHLTEAQGDDVTNVGKLLGACLCLPEIACGVFDDVNQTSKVALALLAETVSRGCRLRAKERKLSKKLKTRHLAQRELLVKALGITQESCHHPTPLGQADPQSLVHSSEFDAVNAKKASGRFFFRESKLSSCPPQAVLACLALTESLRGATEQLQSGNMDTLVNVVHECFDDLTMRSFLHKFVLKDEENVACEPVDLQIALYVQGMAYCSSKTRRKGVASLREPRSVVLNITRSVREELYKSEMMFKKKQMLEALRNDQRALAREIKVQSQLNFLEVHQGSPRIFSPAEVAEMDVDIVLTRCGLPRYRCSFPDCKDYLVDLRTSKDHSFGTRHGLFRHLKYFNHPVDTYVPGLHLFARNVVQANPKITVDVFVEEMLKFIPKHKSHLGLSCWDEYLVDMFEPSVKRWGKYETGKAGSRGEGKQWYEVLSPKRQQEIAKRMETDMARK